MDLRIHIPCPRYPPLRRVNPAASRHARVARDTSSRITRKKEDMILSAKIAGAATTNQFFGVFLRTMGTVVDWIYLLSCLIQISVKVSM